MLVKGGARAEGQKAAASHTGAFASDDRIVDGREAVQFLVRVKEQLEDPARLALQI